MESPCLGHVDVPVWKRRNTVQLRSMLNDAGASLRSDCRPSPSRCERAPAASPPRPSRSVISTTGAGAARGRRIGARRSTGPARRWTMRFLSEMLFCATARGDHVPPCPACPPLRGGCSSRPRWRVHRRDGFGCRQARSTGRDERRGIAWPRATSTMSATTAEAVGVCHRRRGPGPAVGADRRRHRWTTALSTPVDLRDRRSSCGTMVRDARAARHHTAVRSGDSPRSFTR